MELGPELTNYLGSVDFAAGCEDIVGPAAERVGVLAVLISRGGNTLRLPRKCPQTACAEGFQVLPDDVSVRLCADTCVSLWPNYPQLDTVLEVLYTCPTPFPRL